MSQSLLVLASRSPRRAGLLREAGINFEQVDPPFEDPPAPDAAADAVELAMRLARQKAQSALPVLPAGTRWVLAADTIVVTEDGELLGQPVDAGDANRMLNKLLGRWHRVVSGVALFDKNGQEVAALADEAEVCLGPVTKAELDAYMARESWRGKAGAYNLAEIEGRWPMQVRGDPATVVGLPMRRLLTVLRDMGIPGSRERSQEPKARVQHG